MKSIIYTVFAIILFCSCTETPSNPTIINEQPNIFPDYAGVTVPVGIAPLNFNIVGEGVERVAVTIHGENGDNLRTNGKYAKFDIDQWHSLLEKNKGVLPFNDKASPEVILEHTGMSKAQFKRAVGKLLKEG